MRSRDDFGMVYILQEKVLHKAILVVVKNMYLLILIYLLVTYYHSFFSIYYNWLFALFYFEEVFYPRHLIT